MTVATWDETLRLQTAAADRLPDAAVGECAGNVEVSPEDPQLLGEDGKMNERRRRTLEDRARSDGERYPGRSG